jgi:hypothetical protein
MKKWTLPLALATAAVYLTLSVSAATCLFTHQAPPHSTHHHSGEVTHSLLCAWACQANQPVDGPIARPDSQPLTLVGLVLLLAAIQPSGFLAVLAPSRAPPRF